MNLLYIGNWGINDSLTEATIIPHLKILSKLSNIDKIIFCSIERKSINYITGKSLGPKIIHIPLFSSRFIFNYIKYIYDYFKFKNSLYSIVTENQIDCIICRGSPAGIFGYIIHRHTDLPFYVESFEPHARYMYESGVWGIFNPKYLLELFWEGKIKLFSKGLMPVSYNYRDKLILEGIDSLKIDVIPCCVSIDKFQFDQNARNRIRQRLNIQNEITGIYVGKFGGVYYNQKAFDIFSSIFSFFKNCFKLIIITPNNSNDVINSLIKSGIDPNNFYVNKISHNEVPAFLSASDFALSLYKPSISKRYLSPIKNGEYWANGLPILLTRGIGDDSKIIESEGCGATYQLKNNDLNKATKQIESIIMSGTRKQVSKEISIIASRYRNFEIVEQVYNKVYNNSV